MPKLLVCIVNDPHKTDDLLKAWVDVGIPGATILDSYGLIQRHEGFRDDLPLFPSLGNLLRGNEEPHALVFSVVGDGFDVPALVRATESILGKLDDPHTGILFLLPVLQAWGLRATPPLF